eukprot:TRINITY_DN2019_c0_g2_i1.p1 TRINITY_DN2019_c0_g2~~TRINITY_DN2019_c0_g2_i1.p1  ORF type:complete len:448 (-),score=91.93 TRINITY_DN2019_c0_g2_i1:147-1400(-)
MATYINYGEGEGDATVQGAEWLRKVVAQVQGTAAEESFSARFTEYQNVEAHRYDYGPVFDLFLEHAPGVFTYITEGRIEERCKDAENFFALVNSLLLMLEDEDHLTRSTMSLCEMFSGETTYAELRLRLLMMLYNTFTLPTIEFRYRIFKHVLDFAAKAGLFDLILPYLEHLDAWVADWGKFMTDAEKKTLYRDISACLLKLNKRTESFFYKKRYHAMFQGEADSSLSSAEVQDMTIALLKDAIQLPSIMQFDDILNFDNVKALNSSKVKYGVELVSLCGLFLSGSVNDVRLFHEKNQKLFEHHELSFEDVMTKIRLLTLATLAHGKSEMLLSDVAKALDETDDDVEHWVVRAISEGLLDGRIDQLEHKVFVKSAFQRKFGKEEWGFLDTKLTQWIDNLESVVKFIGEQNVTQAKVS